MAASLLAALVLIALRRRPRPWLAAIGTVLLLVAVAITPFELSRPWDGALNIVGYALVLTSYPDGRLPWRWLVAPLAGYGGLAIALLVVGDPLISAPWWTLVIPSEFLLFLVALHRYRRRLSTDERERVRWAVLGATVTFVGMSTLAIVAGVTGVAAIPALGPVAAVLAVLFGGALPACLAIGLLRPRLLPVDPVLRVVIAFVLTAVPLAAAIALLGLIPGISPWWRAALVVVLAIPLLPLARRAADWIVYRGRLSPDRAARLLADRLSADGRPEDAPTALAEAAASALRLAAARVTGAGLHPAAAGDPMAAVTELFPIDYRGTRIAELVVSARAGETALTPRDRAVLVELARRAAPALHGAGAVAELIEARAQAVSAHEEERKRLRRDLHDDLAPGLVGLALTVSGIARLLGEEGHVLAAPAADLAKDVQLAIAQTRALAYGLRPSLLDDQGLVAAMRDQARSSGDLQILIEAPETPLPMSAAVEVAALRIMQEAVTNVRRHARARRCAVRIWIEAGQLRLEVEDDGHGLPVRPSGGLGLASMRDRARELGGRLSLLPGRQGGLLVTVTIPVGTPA